MKFNEPVFTLYELADQLGLDPEVLLQHIFNGKLRAIKLRRPNGLGHLPEIEIYRCTKTQIDQFKHWLEFSQEHDPIYSIQDVAGQLNLPPQVIYSHISAGRLKAHKMRGPTISGIHRRVGAYRCSRAQIDELKTLLEENQGKKWFASRKRAPIAINKEIERNAHNQAISQQLNGLLNNEKRKPLKHD